MTAYYDQAISLVDFRALARGTHRCQFELVWCAPFDGSSCTNTHIAYGNTHAECVANALADIETWRANERAKAAAQLRPI